MDLILKYSKTGKGKECLVYNGYVFYLDKMDEKKRIWKCSQYYTTKCRARIHIQGEKIVKHLPDPFYHNHAAEAAELEARNHMVTIKNKALNSEQGSTQQIIINELGNVSAAAAPKMPLERTIKRTVRRVRNQNSKNDEEYHVLPVCRKSIDIPECFRKTKKNVSFLLYDSGEDPDYDNGADHELRFIVFATQDFLKILSQGSCWYADGMQFYFKTFCS